MHSFQLRQRHGSPRFVRKMTFPTALEGRFQTPLAIVCSSGFACGCSGLEAMSPVSGLAQRNRGSRSRLRYGRLLGERLRPWGTNPLAQGTLAESRPSLKCWPRFLGREAFLRPASCRISSSFPRGAADPGLAFPPKGASFQPHQPEPSKRRSLPLPYDHADRLGLQGGQATRIALRGDPKSFPITWRFLVIGIHAELGVQFVGKLEESFDCGSAPDGSPGGS
jgi:hypothetical protein